MGQERKCVAVDRKYVAGRLIGRLSLLALLFLLLQAVATSCGALLAGGQEAIGSAMRMEEGYSRDISEEAKSLLYGQFLPMAALLEGRGYRGPWLLQEGADCLMPLYGYLVAHMEREQEAEGPKRILLAESLEEPGPPEELSSKDGLSQQAEEPIGNLSGDQGSLGNQIKDSGKNPAEKTEEGQEDLAEFLRAENEAALQRSLPYAFLPREKQVRLDLAALEDYETLLKQFYTVDANTMAGSDQLNVRRFLEADLGISKEGEGPQILIYHTHSKEAYADSPPGDASATIMGVGERLASILTEQYGYRVLHHLGRYDTESRDDSYAKALTDLEALLRENPSIQVAIDLHRDEMPEGMRLAMDLDGRPTARFMFFNGLSRTRKTGNIAYLYNGNLDGNLAFSFRMQKAALEYYPNLTRKIYLKGYRYNLHLLPRSLLVELGAQNNTLEEAMNACDPLAHILDLVLSGGA